MTAVHNRAAWWSRAACSTADPDLFFPISGAGLALKQVTRAKAICARCPIQQACLGYALDASPIQGVWGGTTEAERRRLGHRPAGHTPAARQSRRLARAQPGMPCPGD